jgi:hypothetical protein
VTRASFRKYVKKSAERASRLAEREGTHEVSSACLCLQCVMARYHALSASLEGMLFEVVQKKVARKSIVEVL